MELIENKFALIVLVFLSVVFISSFAIAEGGRYVVGGGDANCVQGNNPNDIYTPGSVGGGAKTVSWRLGLTEYVGVPIGPTVTLNESSLKISSDYKIIQVKVNSSWYTADPYGYIKVPGETEAKILTLNPDDKTATMIYDNFIDHCIDDSLLLKYDCTATGYQKEINCPNGCSEGACISDTRSSSTGLLNIDYGSWDSFPSQKVGAGVVGGAQDYWNTVVESWNDNKLKENLKYADKQTSPISVRSVNLGGSWSTNGQLSFKDVMLATYSYPQNNQGGDSKVILSKVPQGNFDLYIYGFSLGDYEVTADGVNYGRRVTLPINEALTTNQWTEGLNYVKFANINVTNGEINIYMRAGGAPFYDTLISGLQLIPASGQSPNPNEVSEDVTCKFNNNLVISYCYADDGQMCEANKTDSCTVNVKSALPSLQWKSFCSGGGTTQMDGQAKTVEFNCTGAQPATIDKLNYYNSSSNTTRGVTEVIPIQTITPTTLPITNPDETQVTDINSEQTNADSNNSAVTVTNSNSTSVINQQTIQAISAASIPTTIAEPTPIVCKDSCAYAGKCYPFGYRKDNKFCSDTTFFSDELAEESACQNNFECTTNVCVSGKCISASFIDQIIAWFKNIFG